MKKLKFQQFVWGVLAYNIAVVLWGAFVRATHSGAGCGSHWPTCNGEVIPFAPSTETLIEFTHRLTSGFALILVIALFVWAWRAFPKGHQVVVWAGASLALTVSEALIGAGLVLAGLVANNTSALRVVVMSSHLVNTFLLLGALTITAWTASSGRRFAVRSQGAVGWAIWIGIVATVGLGITGAIAALGDTLFPANSLRDGLAQDFTASAHFLIRLRVLHPLLAGSVGLYLLLLAGLVMHLRPSPGVRRMGRLMVSVFLFQIALGGLNLILLAPVWMQIVHLLTADLNWVVLILLAAESFAVGVDHVENQNVAAQHALSAEALPSVESLGRPTLGDFVALTKPRVISLLLFTTLTAMVIAAGGWPGTFLFIAVAIGGYMSAGAANAINMVIDRDIDVRMDRTASRPTVTQKIPSRDALLFAYVLAGCSFAILWSVANLLTAMLSLAGLVCYVIVYTLYLKRRTWSNIVIGGAAGAFPPLVGWAAVTGDLNLLAWTLFTIIFLWTPVHFWALALLLKDDYERAGIPMLPVVLGVRVTVIQIGFYTILTVAISALPVVLGETGKIYLVVAAVLNAVLLLRSLQLYQRPDRPRASSLFKFSMMYLALLFLAMAVDRTVWM